MKPTKIITDIVMYILFLLLMGQYLLRDAPHEWLGMAFGGLFILHNILNLKWYMVLFKGKYNAVRIMQTAMNFLLLIAVICCMLSGVFVSQYIFDIGNGSTIVFGRTLHLVSTAWAFILMSLHFGMHLGAFIGMVKKISKNKSTANVLKCAFIIMAAVICLYGAYLFTKRRFWEELFHLMDFQKEYDYTKMFSVYCVESAAISAMFVVIGYCAKLILTKARKQK